MIFPLHNPERIVVDCFNFIQVQKKLFPMNFTAVNLVKCVRISVSANMKNTRIVLDLSGMAYIESIVQKKSDKNYQLILTIVKHKKYITNVNDMLVRNVNSSILYKEINFNTQKKACNKKNVKNIKFDKNFIRNKNKNYPIVVAIDAGHGGQDPGAISCIGIYEKSITMAIARKLKNFLDIDPMFKSMMIRDDDCFVSVLERSDLARKKGAHVLISIHADSACDSSIRGVSTWILSNSRAKTEIMNWLKRKDKYSELLGGLNEILINDYNNDPYFNYLVLDLQFGYAQQVGYDIATHVLHQLKSVSLVHKDLPEYSSFGILRSFEIPSILIETGFLSNKKDACLLSDVSYQEKIAKALYLGLRFYFHNKLQKLLNCNKIIKNDSYFVMS